MSGIFGYISCRNDISDIRVSMKKLQLWNHAYGKDAEEVLIREHFGMGCCYEKLSDEAKGNQPVLKMNGKYAVIDALLYNREELLEKCCVQGIFSDEALLFHYIEKFGLDALKEVNGDFSGAVYDDEKKTLVLFRDHLGVRPLYYFMKDETVVFSTDIRGLTALSQVDTAVNEDWIFKTVSGYTTNDTEATEFAHIFCVKPAGYIRISTENQKVEAAKSIYWKLGRKKIRLSSEKAYMNKLRELVTDSVKRRLDAVAGLVGAELSGGLDSGVIDILISRLGRECVYFSWSVDPKELPMAENDERLVIEDICKQENVVCNYGKRHLDLSLQSDLAESMRQIGLELKTEEPPAMRYALPPYINALVICEASHNISKRGAKVVFSGHGGDEGVSHRCSAYELFYHHEYYHFLRQMWSISHGQKSRLIKTLKYVVKCLKEAKNKYKKPFHNPFGAPELLKVDFAKQFDEKKMPVLHFAYDPKAYVMEAGSRNRLDNVALLGAHCGVRYLIPYLDYRLIDFAVSIPRYLYLKGNKNRYIFREAFKDIMPNSLYSLRFKEDNSRKNMEENPNWFEEYAKRKNDAVSKLNRQYWGKYLDFDLIDEWLQRGKPSEEERFSDECILRSLFACALVGNMVEKSKEINS